jgi:serine/threonine protein kinase
MGEVYLVRDRRLERQAALKILPKDLASNPDRLQRFIRETKAASAINHPNVATIYDVGEADGISFTAMEYVAGETLASRLNAGALDWREIVDIGVQVADALDAAQTLGITHRDIKPANIMITPRGQVKVLDFGLAKVTPPGDQTLNSSIPTAAETTPGVVLGTIHYMSPEQVLGFEVDHRTDIFSLGVVLYEMATGRRPFTGATGTQTMDRILHADPEAILSINGKAPPELQRIASKCLEKDRARRYQSSRDLVADLRSLQGDGVKANRISATQAGSRPKTPGRRLAVIGIALAILALGLSGIWRYLLRNNVNEDVIDSIAVLPFVNDSGTADTEYLSDGITESLINSLSQLPELRVIARTTAFTYKGKELDPVEIHKKLNVRAVLTGRLAQRGDTLTIQVEFAATHPPGRHEYRLNPAVFYLRFVKTRQIYHRRRDHHAHSQTALELLRSRRRRGNVVTVRRTHSEQIRNLLD